MLGLLGTVALPTLLMSQGAAAFVHRGVSSAAGRTATYGACRGVHSTVSRQSWSSLKGSLQKMFSAAPTTADAVGEVDPGEVEGLQVIKYPDQRLRAPNEEITEFTPELQKLTKQMFKLMYAAHGVGLAAPQVGVNKRLMVFNPDGDPVKWLSEVVLVNPKIVDKSGKTDVEEEGCLSFPDMSGDVERSLAIKVEYQNVKGKKFMKKFKDWEARIFQHEYDHLDGVLYIDRLSPEGREKVQPVLDKLVKAHGPGGAL